MIHVAIITMELHASFNGPSYVRFLNLKSVVNLYQHRNNKSLTSTDDSNP